MRRLKVEELSGQRVGLILRTYVALTHCDVESLGTKLGYSRTQFSRYLNGHAAATAKLVDAMEDECRIPHEMRRWLAGQLAPQRGVAASFAQWCVATAHAAIRTW